MHDVRKSNHQATKSTEKSGLESIPFCLVLLVAWWFDLMEVVGRDGDVEALQSTDFVGEDGDHVILVLKHSFDDEKRMAH